MPRHNIFLEKLKGLRFLCSVHESSFLLLTQLLSVCLGFSPSLWKLLSVRAESDCIGSKASNSPSDIWLLEMLRIILQRMSWECWSWVWPSFRFRNSTSCSESARSNRQLWARSDRATDRVIDLSHTLHLNRSESHFSHLRSSQMHCSKLWRSVRYRFLPFNWFIFYAPS